MLQIAKVLKSNGTDGDILIGLSDIAIEEIDTKEPVFIEFDGLPVPFFFESLNARGNGRAIAHITSVDRLEDAEEIVGRSMAVDYFEEEEIGDDFTGWKVYDGDRKIGEVKDLEDIPGNPCLEVVVEGKEVLVPLHEDLIVKIDKKGRQIIFSLPEGFLNALL